MYQLISNTKTYLQKLNITQLKDILNKHGIKIKNLKQKVCLLL